MSLNILTGKEFESEIKKIIREKSPISMIDAVLLFCEQRQIEIETAASLINTRMKSVIEGEAIKSRLIKTGKARLPIDD